MAPVNNDDGDGRKLLASRAVERERALSAYKGSKSSGDAFGADFSRMPLKPDHTARPCWTCPDGNIYLEAFHDLYVQAYDFLVAIAEPVARPEFVHQYKLTAYSLYAAVATNITTDSIVSVLERLSKNQLPKSVQTFIRECTKQYGKAKLVLKHNKVYVESENPQVLRDLLRDPTIAKARVKETDAGADAEGFLTHSKAEEMKENLHMLEPDEDSDEEDAPGGEQQQQQRTVVSFQILGEQVEQVKRQAIELDYPLSRFASVHGLATSLASFSHVPIGNFRNLTEFLLARLHAVEEYDFRNDHINPNVYKFDLKPHTRIRRYQERSLAKMFGNGRARSGIIVLPCTSLLCIGRGNRNVQYTRVESHS
jgi:DNA excision repair protein ERCC-3